MPIKASEFYCSPTLKFLEGKFKTNEAKKESCKKYVKNVIKLAFYRENIFSLEKLSKILEGENIHMILRKSGEGQIYGITYVDHKTRSVFNGSNLGKEFSAKGIQESCAKNILSLERKCQNSVSNNSEYFQNLASKEYVKKNLYDILIRSEEINDSVPKKFQQKKKRRFFKGI